MVRVVLAAFVALATIAVSADGYVVFSSWQSKANAEKEAERTADELSVTPEVIDAVIDDTTWYRVVVEVESKTVADPIIANAKENGWQPWYVKKPEGSQSATSDGGSSPNVLSTEPTPSGSVDDGDATLESTLRDVEQIRERAENLISEFETTDDVPTGSVPMVGNSDEDATDSATGEVEATASATDEVDASDSATEEGDSATEESEDSEDSEESEDSESEESTGTRESWFHELRPPPGRR